VAERCNYTSVEDLLAGLGYGEITLNAVVNRIREAVRQYQQAALPPLPPESNEDVLRALVQSHRAAAPASSSQTPILGIEGLVYKLAGCCSPLPGEPIIASIALGGHGLSIHRQGCSNIDGIPGDRLIPVSWNTEEQKGRAKTYPVRLRLEVIDRVGVLRDVLNRLIDQSINVNNANVSTTSNRPARIDLCLDIANHRQLCQLSAQLKKMSDVLSVTRLGAPTEETCEIS
jgi:(p)ppGpp synthase/HD superfamily hydrolase